MRGKKRKAWKDTLRVGRAQANASALKGVLLDSGHSFAASDGSVRTEDSKAAKQRTSLQGERLMLGHGLSPSGAGDFAAQPALTPAVAEANKVTL
jgi:hypothetical protein